MKNFAVQKAAGTKRFAPAIDVQSRLDHAEEDVRFAGLHGDAHVGRAYRTVGGIREPRTVSRQAHAVGLQNPAAVRRPAETDRKSTRLNSSHLGISYAVFCLK